MCTSIGLYVHTYIYLTATGVFVHALVLGYTYYMVEGFRVQGLAVRVYR